MPVTGLVNGKCNSATLIILAGCKKRYATKHSKFLFHGMKSARTANTCFDVQKAIELATLDWKKVFDNLMGVFLKFPF